jgi:hypothetical protein
VIKPLYTDFRHPPDRVGVASIQFLQELMYGGLWAINAYGNYCLSAPKVLRESKSPECVKLEDIITLHTLHTWDDGASRRGATSEKHANAFFEFSFFSIMVVFLQTILLIYNYKSCFGYQNTNIGCKSYSHFYLA